MEDSLSYLGNLFHQFLKYRLFSAERHVKCHVIRPKHNIYFKMFCAGSIFIYVFRNMKNKLFLPVEIFDRGLSIVERCVLFLKYCLERKS